MASSSCMVRPKSGSGGSEAVSLALRIVTIALSAASAAMMASAKNECSGGVGGGCSPAGNNNKVSYSDYNSFKYALAANLVSAALQAAALLLTLKAARGHRSNGKEVKSLAELVDTASQVFLYSSSGLSLAVDDFGSCGRRVTGVCKCAGVFCRWVRSSGAVSVAAAVALSLSQFIKDVPLSVSFDGDDDEHKAKRGCGQGCHCHH